MEASRFRQFAKIKNNPSARLNNRAVIYTRVSTKEQAENNLSLETQRRYCEEYARRSKLRVIDCFGGTYESAKTDERKEFQRMLHFVKKQREKISYIIVFSIDRFSRSGSNAIYISEQLKKQGIHILSVTQQIESQTPAGKFQQNMFFMFSQLDNDMRREKTVAGMREMLRQGYWATKAPVGYKHVPATGREGRIVADETGKLIKQAFVWKAQEGISNVEIIERLANLGFKIHKQQLTKIFSNPFYCGLLTSTLIEGEVIRGKHPAIISEELFLQVNEMQAKNYHGKRDKETPQFPLKGFVKCDSCGTALTAYRIKGKKAMYYKCNTKGCSCNYNSGLMHDKFQTLLGRYAIAPEAIAPMSAIMAEVFQNMNEGNLANRAALLKQLQACKQKTEAVEERFVLGEIDRILYEKFISRYGEERRVIEQKLEECDCELSNLEECTAYALQLGSELPAVWEKSGYKDRQRLQNLLFPEGLRFNRENREYRTSRVNSLFAPIPLLSGIYNKQKSGLAMNNLAKSALVARRELQMCLMQFDTIHNIFLSN